MVARCGVSQEIYLYVNKMKSEDFEKTIPYMYVDTVNCVTVGVGHNLTRNGDILELPFVVKRFERHAVLGGDAELPIETNRKVGRPATNQEIQNDYDFLVRHTGLGRYSAENLEKYTTVELPHEAIDELFGADLTTAVGRCVTEFGPGLFLSLPITCQAALIDISYNCGSFRSFRGHFVPAIKGEKQYARMSLAERLRTAAQHSRRGAVNDVRNNTVAQWLLTGAAQCRLAGK